MEKTFQDMTTDERLAEGLITEEEAHAERVKARVIEVGEVVLIAIRALDAHDRGHVVYEVLGSDVQLRLSVEATMGAEKAAQAVYEAGESK